MSKGKRRRDKEDDYFKSKRSKDETPEQWNKLESEYKLSRVEAKRKKLQRQLLFKKEVEIISKDDDFPLPWEDQGNAFLVGIVGRRKSGKTFFLDQMMKTVWLKEFNKIYILSKTAKQQDYFKTWDGDITYVEEWSFTFFDDLKREKLAKENKEDGEGVPSEPEKKKKKKKEKILIVIDDMSSDMREKLYSTNIDAFSFIGRHFGFSIVWLAQKITLFTPGFRQEADAFFLFREENMQELRLLHREWGFGDLDQFICLLTEETQKRYSWVMIRNIGGTVHLFKLPESTNNSDDGNGKISVDKQGVDERLLRSTVANGTGISARS